MPISFDTSQVFVMRARLDHAGAGATNKARAVVSRTAAAIERDAKVLAPYEFGTLRNSIITVLAGTSATIGPTVNYGGYQEFGTSKMPPHPYMGPALDRNTGPFQQALSQIVADAP